MDMKHVSITGTWTGIFRLRKLTKAGFYEPGEILRRVQVGRRRGKRNGKKTIDYGVEDR